MGAPDPSLRVQGVAVPDVSDWSEPLPAGKWSQFFWALSKRVILVGVTRPLLSRTHHYLSLARAFSPDRATWQARAGFNLRHVAKVNAALERELARASGSYDLIVQLQTLCSPRSPSISTPYVIYTDSTMALIRRLYPSMAPLSPKAIAEWERFEAAVCHAAQAVFTFSEFARQSMIEDYGCAADHVTAIGAGANQLLDSLSDKDYGGRRALFVGNEFERKGGLNLLAAWRLVHDRIPDAELVIVGPKRDPAPGFGAGLSWRGRVDRSELARLYRSASVFVLPSNFEPWGHVFVEAMGNGLPCIGSDCCAMPELIGDGVSGRLVSRGAVHELADAIVELLSDPGLAARMGRAGHERVLSELTWAHVADRFVHGLA